MVWCPILKNKESATKQRIFINVSWSHIVNSDYFKNLNYFINWCHKGVDVKLLSNSTDACNFDLKRNIFVMIIFHGKQYFRWIIGYHDDNSWNVFHENSAI